MWGSVCSKAVTMGRGQLGSALPGWRALWEVTCDVSAVAPVAAVPGLCFRSWAVGWAWVCGGGHTASEVPVKADSVVTITDSGWTGHSHV